MKINNVPGEFGFKGLVRQRGFYGWELTNVFLSLEDIIANYEPIYEIKWPVEVFEDGSVYIPSEEEFK